MAGEHHQSQNPASLQRARSPVRNVLFTEATPPETFGRAFGFERARTDATAAASRPSKKIGTRLRIVLSRLVQKERSCPEEQSPLSRPYREDQDASVRSPRPECSFFPNRGDYLVFAAAALNDDEIVKQSVSTNRGCEIANGLAPGFPDVDGERLPRLVLKRTHHRVGAGDQDQNLRLIPVQQAPRYRRIGRICDLGPDVRAVGGQLGKCRTGAGDREHRSTSLGERAGDPTPQTPTGANDDSGPTRQVTHDPTLLDGQAHLGVTRLSGIRRAGGEARSARAEYRVFVTATSFAVFARCDRSNPTRVEC
jgi:hypothetical protein